MNKRSHIHKKADSSASNPVFSQLQSRPFIAQAKPQSQKPLTQTEIENQEFQQQKFEATKLKLQAKYGTITPEGQERLTVLQAKMSGSLQRRLEHTSSFGSNFANIPISRPDPPSQQVVQTKLTIGEPGDKYEQEADRVAAQVVNQINAPISQQAGQNVQREEISEEEKDLQMKPMLQLRSAAGGMTATTDLETGIQQARSGGQPLAANIRQPMEQAFGADFSKVKVHTDTHADQLNQSIQAKAFTTGQDVFFRSGEYNPGSRGGQELIAHELTHVVQQRETVARSIQRMPTKGPNPLKQKIKAGEDVAGAAKADDLKDYENLLNHMGGEFDGKNVTGGHLLTEMEKQWKDRLQYQAKGSPNSAGVWKMDWSIDGITKVGGSTMFPEQWTLKDLTDALKGSTQSRNGRVFKANSQDFNVKKSGGTFYPEF